MTTHTDWHGYQHAAADFFRRLGYKAEVDAHVQGVRAAHDIDVYVTFQRYGLHYRWIVECKLWSSSVPKEKVAALRDIVLDIGADRGLLIAEKGFQAGAHAAARYSNIVLTTLGDLERHASKELQADILTNISIEAQSLHRRLQIAAITAIRISPKAPTLTTLPRADADAIRSRAAWSLGDALDALNALARAAVQARDDSLPVHVLDPFSGDMALATTVDDFIAIADTTLAAIASRIGAAEQNDA
jgi:hypothetical protein